MKIFNNLIILFLISAFAIADECRLFENPDECMDVEGCIWNEDLNFCQSSEGDNDWEDECRFLETEDECTDAGCIWDDEDGCYSDWENDEDNDIDCDELGQEDCYDVDYCQWTDAGCEYIDEDEEDNDWDGGCEGLDEDECNEIDDCEWNYSNNLPEGGFCSESDWEDDDNENGPPECVMDCDGIEGIDPDEDLFGFCEWLINLDDSCLSDCDDETLEEIIEFYSFCEDCLEDNNCNEDWEDGCEGLDEDECNETDNCEWNYSNNLPEGGFCSESDWEENYECEGLSEEDCVWLDYCVWDDEGNECYDYENEEDWECIYDCDGIGEFDPADDADAFCNWIINLESDCTEDCDNEIIEQLQQISDFCELCLDNQNCDEVFNEEGEGDGLMKLDSVSSQPGSIVEIDVYMESNVDVGGFQFNIYDQPNWVTGIEIESHIDCFEASINDIDGYLIAIMFSLEGCSIDPTDGLNVATIYYTLSDEAEYGENVELVMDNLIVSDTNGDALAFDMISGNIMVGGLLGDVNQDGEINVLDIVQAINFILLISNPTESEFVSADVNEDGSLDILDIVGIVNLIQGSDREGYIDNNSKAFYSINNNELELSANSISGFQIKLENNSNIISSNLPSDWYIYSSNGIVLAYTMNSPLNRKIALNFNDNIQVEDIIVSDSYGNEIQSSYLIEPRLFSLNESYPNPFNPITSISFDLYDNLNSSIKIYNITGQLVDVLHEGYLDIGYHSFTWDASNQVSGIYFMSLQFGTTIKTQKLMLIK